MKLEILRNQQIKDLRVQKLERKKGKISFLLALHFSSFPCAKLPIPLRELHFEDIAGTQRKLVKRWWKNQEWLDSEDSSWHFL